jgi:hypothetical protein
MRTLSKADMRNVMGGKTACSITYQDSSGGWHTDQGSCSVAVSGTTPSGATIYSPYCATTLFPNPVTLSSNGGVSKCGSPYTFLSQLFS